ncbi:MAG: AMP-binding protein [Bacteroidota bacterium]
MQVHPLFKLNDDQLDAKSLANLAQAWISSGESYKNAVGDFLLDWLSPSDFITTTTSGSTGNPKRIRLSKVHMKNSALATGAYFALEAGDKALLCLSANYIAGKMMLVRALVLGLSLDVIAPSSQPLEGLKSYYDFVAMVPLQVSSSLAQLKQIKILIVGGAPITSTLRKQLYLITTSVYETYGMTETVSHIAVKPVNKEDTVGFEILPQVEITQDHRGCLVIKAPQVASQTIFTNDIVALLDETHFSWLGRWDNVINSGGIKLFPEQIEEKLAPFIKQRFFVAGMPDKKLGDQMVLVIEGSAIPVNKLLETIRVSRVLAKYEMPRTVFFKDCFIETETGKIRRKAILDAILNENFDNLGVN